MWGKVVGMIELDIEIRIFRDYLSSLGGRIGFREEITFECWLRDVVRNYNLTIIVIRCGKKVW